MFSLLSSLCSVDISSSAASDLSTFALPVLSVSLDRRYREMVPYIVCSMNLGNDGAEHDQVLYLESWVSAH